MTWEPGRITQIDGDWMSVKVPTGTDCRACAHKSACTFQGPDSAYRTLRIARSPAYAVGDRVLIDEPGSVLFVALLAFVGLPMALMTAGYWLRDCCVRFAVGTTLLWVLGILVWLVALYGVNYWMTRSPTFQAQVRPIEVSRPADGGRDIEDG